MTYYGYLFQHYVAACAWEYGGDGMISMIGRGRSVSGGASSYVA